MRSMPSVVKSGKRADLISSAIKAGLFRKALAKEKDIGIVDVFTPTYKALHEKDGLFTKDGIHYTEEGFNALGDVVAKKILEIL